jgi:hypothetical protein
MPHAEARHRKPTRSARNAPVSIPPYAPAGPARSGRARTEQSGSRHRKQPAKTSITPAVRRSNLGRAAVASTAVLALGAAGAAAYTFLPGRIADGQPRTSHVTNGLGLALADAITTKNFPAAKPAGKHAGPASQSARHDSAHQPRHARSSNDATRTRPKTPVYLNPLRAVSGLIPERIDMGVDFGGSGPVYAIGDGVVTNATGENGGWPGGGWITYQLTDGPAAGLVVYVAEDVTPAVSVGEKVTPDTVVANMYNGGDGIETGWAMPDGASALSQLPEAGSIGGDGPFPTYVGVSFEDLLTELGVPAAENAGETPSGLLPAGYLTNWGLG